MKKRIWITTAIISGLILVLIISINIYVNESTKSFLYASPNLIPVRKAGILLGTSKHLKNGHINEFWMNRIVATAELYNLKKISIIIISGDNSKKSYDEPTDMKTELMKFGIPDSVIYLDYAGFRTFDSMIRAYKIFGQKSFTVISQEFHNQRAIFIARHYGLDAIGYNAREVRAYNGFKTKLREKFARVKLLADLLLDKQPRFLGEKVEIK